MSTKLEILRAWLRKMVRKTNKRRVKNQGLEARIEAIEYALASLHTQAQIEGMPVTPPEDEDDSADVPGADE